MPLCRSCSAQMPVLQGRFVDARVGRDVLISLTAGAVMQLLIELRDPLQWLTGAKYPAASFGNTRYFEGTRYGGARGGCDPDAGGVARRPVGDGGGFPLELRPVRHAVDLRPRHVVLRSVDDRAAVPRRADGVLWLCGRGSGDTRWGGGRAAAGERVGPGSSKNPAEAPANLWNP
ncbi:MAG: hypothetical protein ABIX28_22165 [Vicinamibacterales bacterium]